MDYRTTSIKRVEKISIILIIALQVPFLFTNYKSQIQAQVISHELRRIAIASNQFGIDALKALDRIEPPDKVLVFCPICLSSSLMMIMMGSSKYQVVSALRQALYVWSMKPHEINQGFRDLFDHLGLNEQQQFKMHSRHANEVSKGFSNQSLVTQNRFTRSLVDFDSGPFDHYEQLTSNRDHLSLPKLLKSKESLEQAEDGSRKYWWQVIREAESATISQGKSRESNLKRANRPTVVRVKPSGGSSAQANSTNRFRNTGAGETGFDLSQMSAISNIYIQRGLAMNYNYNLLLRKYYKTVIHPVDFFRNGEETRQHINSLVAAGSEGKIRNLIKKSAFDNGTVPKILMISTFHFRGTLDVQIKEFGGGPLNKTTNDLVGINQNSARGKRNNHTPLSKQPEIDKKPIKQSSSNNFIETEESLLKYGSFSSLDCTVIEIPFNNRLVSLVIVMPNHLNSTELLVTKLSAQILNDMKNSLIVKKISIEIPVIKFDRGPINVEGIIRELGLAQLFFGGEKFLLSQQQSSESGLNRWMRPSDIIHETSIDIGTINPRFAQTEDRLKVGAHENDLASNDQQATNQSQNQKRASPANIRRKKSSQTTTPTSESHIKLDKPFFYFVLDSINGLVLTMGRIR